ncbi:MAG: hypothetical protein V3V12_09925 [Gammaproteobacteria bacterium]
MNTAIHRPSQCLHQPATSAPPSLAQVTLLAGWASIAPGWDGHPWPDLFKVIVLSETLGILPLGGVIHAIASITK